MITLACRHSDTLVREMNGKIECSFNDQFVDCCFQWLTDGKTKHKKRNISVRNNATTDDEPLARSQGGANHLLIFGDEVH